MEKFKITKEQALSLWERAIANINNLNDIVSNDSVNGNYDIKIDGIINLNISNVPEFIPTINIVFDNYIEYAKFELSKEELVKCLEILSTKEGNLSLIKKQENIRIGESEIKSLLEINLPF